MQNIKAPEIIFEDEQVVAVVKPAGMIVNKADTAKGIYTLQDFSEEKIGIKNKSITDAQKEAYMVDGYNKYDEFISRGGIVHRLDKETSGIILIAKTPEVFINLQNQFKSKIVKKKYIALVHGVIENKSGVVDAPIARLPWNRMRFGVIASGRNAVTHYNILSKNELFTLVEVFPETGRTHQIRVHFQHIQHPIFADELYAGRKTGRNDRKILSRHFLHAKELSFLHPVTNFPQVLSARLPEDLQKFLDSLDNFK